MPAFTTQGGNRPQQVLVTHRGGPVGHFRVSWPNARPDGANLVPQYSLISNHGVVMSGTGAGDRTSTSIVIKTQDCNQVFYDFDFWLTIH